MRFLPPLWLPLDAHQTVAPKRLSPTPCCCPPLPLLAGLGDIANTRTLYERALNATTPEAAAELWDAYLAFEYDVGTLQVGGWGHKPNSGGDVFY